MHNYLLYYGAYYNYGWSKIEEEAPKEEVLILKVPKP